MFRINQDNLNRFIINGLMVILFLAAPFYIQPNFGIAGHYLPFNYSVWAAALTIVFYAGYNIALKQKIYLPANVKFIVAFPLLLIVSSLFSGYVNASDWVIKQLFILGGLLFLLSLFQFNLDDKDIEKILFIISMSAIVHAGLGVLQNLNHSMINNSTGRPSGIFGQINVQASYLSTGVLINYFLLSRDNLAERTTIFKVTLIFSIFVSSYILSNAGSRMGIMSMVLGLILLLLAYKSEFLKNKKTVMVATIVLVIAMLLGHNGLGRVLEKGHEMVRDEYADARMVIYAISFNMIKAEPIWGHGLGSFMRVWNEFASQFYALHPGVQRVDGLTHPHNELILWLIEAGILGVLGLLLWLYIILKAAVRCGWKDGLGYLALLLPISFHTQVEFPFYLSSLHWFLWLFLIYCLFKKAGDIYTILLHIKSSKVYLAILMSIYFPVLYFIYHCELSRRDLYDYVHNRYLGQSSEPLKLASSNILFKNDAELVAMHTFSVASIKNKNVNNIKFYLNWANQYIKAIPNIKIYEDMANAYAFLGNNQKRCEIARRGLLNNSSNEALQKHFDKCDSAKIQILKEK